MNLKNTESVCQVNEEVDPYSIVILDCYLRIVLDIYTILTPIWLSPPMWYFPNLATATQIFQEISKENPPEGITDSIST